MPSQTIYTIGYGSRTIAEFLEIIREYKIQYLIDVRSRPYSRYNPDFSKQNLEHHLNGIDVGYVFLGDSLGGMPEDPECYSDGKVDYDRVLTKAFYKRGIDRLVDAWGQDLRVILMCSEEKPERCHRSKLIGRSLVKRGIDVMHIDENCEEIDQDEAILRVLAGQPSLFGDDFHNFTSRKKYGQNVEETDTNDEDRS